MMMTQVSKTSGHAAWLAAMMALSGCASVAHQAGTEPLSNGRTQTDASVRGDYQGYKTQQAAIKALNDAGNFPVKNYSLAKAQCWLDVSLHEYSRNDRSRFPQLAMDESVKITDFASKNGAAWQATSPVNETLSINDAARLREDLWAQAASFKQQVSFKCAQQQVACAEVELVHAGHEYQQQGWRHAKPYVQIAEDLLSDAKAAMAACKPAPSIVPVPAAMLPVTPPPAVVSAPAPVVAVPVVKTIEKIVLNASALFRFDKRNAADLLPQGKAQLDELASKINAVYASVQSIQLVGYTDRLGADSYNQQLSLDRANTVKSYLQGKGLSAAITSTGRGKAEPLVQCAGGITPTPNLTQCLQPNRRVEITITGVKL
jgi:OmpA-OmpF porin, OOP family